MNEQTFNSMAPSTPLNKPSKALHGPNRQPLDTLGSVTVSLAHKDKSITQEVFVIPKLTHNLLGLPAITALDLVTKWMPYTMVDQSFTRSFRHFLVVWGKCLMSTKFA